MSYSIVPSEDFQKEFKQLSKKYPSLVNDIANLGNSLKEEPIQGTSLGNNCYKIRLGIRSKGKGKRGGVRVITYVQVIKTTIYLLSIYDKSDQENITDQEIIARIIMLNPQKKKQ